MILKTAARLWMSILVVGLLTTNGSANTDQPNQADCETGLSLCDKALADCDTLTKDQAVLIDKLKALALAKDAQISNLEGHDKIIYRQPLPWLLLGAAVSLINPVIGVPLLAVGIAREL